MLRAILRGLLPALLITVFAVSLARAQGSYVNFETVPVRPVALSPDGSTLAVTNVPDNRVELFSVSGGGLLPLASVPVGLEPVAVNFRTNAELWVVNHLSDSVSVIDTSLAPPRVLRTLLAGDEPWDVVFGGTRAQPTDPFPRAFVSATRRGQNHPDNPKSELLPVACVGTIDNPPDPPNCHGINGADVWAFEAGSLGNALVGNHLAIIPLFGDKPRALAVTPDGSTVYAAVFHGGNQTTTIFESVVCDGFGGAGSCQMPNGLQVPGGVSGPDQDSVGNLAPETGIIVKWNGSAWMDNHTPSLDWSNAVPFSLPDNDVFVIDADATPPVQTGSFSGVGTIHYNMIVHPDGRLFVSNTDANNMGRFEGPDLGFGGLRGHLHEARVSILTQPSTIKARHLNKHIVYGPGFPTQFTPGKSKADSLSTPLGMELSADGSKLYVAALGSAKIGVFDVASLDDGSFEPAAATHILLSGRGPAGMVRDDANNLMYAYTRFDNAVKVIDLVTDSEDDSYPLHDVEPPAVTDGRRFLYDADFTSSNGEASCAGCHVLGDKDDLAWNLGNPGGTQVPNLNPFTVPPQFGLPNVFHPLKGPMTTQTFRGMAGMGPMHWRGDRTENDPPNQTGGVDEVQSFKQFSVAFEGLLGREQGALLDAEMTAYANFALTLIPPPNPHRQLNHDLCTAADVANPARPLCLADEAFGEDVYRNFSNNETIACRFCHTQNKSARLFGGDGNSSEEGEAQFFKIPHIRNVYDKHGMFGTTIGLLPPDSLGPQIRGTGVLHDGAVANVFDFVSADAFGLSPERHAAVTAFMFVFDTNLAPVVGQQVTLTQANAGIADVTNRIALFEQSAGEQFDGNPFDAFGNNDMECELTVKGVVSNIPRGWVYDAGAAVYRDDVGNSVSPAGLQNIATSAAEQALTYTCAYPNGGERIGRDRDDDAILDGQQCGDVGGDGLVTGLDPTATRGELAGQGPSPFIVQKCSVAGAVECDIADVAVTLRQLAGANGPGLQQVCTAAL